VVRAFHAARTVGHTVQALVPEGRTMEEEKRGVNKEKASELFETTEQGE
jgi:hypothetical protein